MCPIKLVGFDLDDCLFDSTGLSERARIKGIKAMINLGLDINPQEAIDTIQEIVKEYGSNFEMHYDYFIRRLNHRKNSMNISYTNQYKYIAAAIIAYHQEKIDSINLYDDVEDCLKKLNSMRIQSIIISDGSPVKQNEKILRLGLDKLIDSVFISDQIGIKKPNKKLFEYCLNTLEVKSSEAIYIGDRIDMDIIPAKMCGIHAIYIHRGGKYDFYNSHEKIPQENKPDYEISSLKEIFKIIEKINSQ
ncbi:MAG: TIGR02253 family HAD-type hydrolase [Promethearchaeota archaeon]